MRVQKKQNIEISKKTKSLTITVERLRVLVVSRCAEFMCKYTASVSLAGF